MSIDQRECGGVWASGGYNRFDDFARYLNDECWEFCSEACRRREQQALQKVVDEFIFDEFSKKSEIVAYLWRALCRDNLTIEKKKKPLKRWIICQEGKMFIEKKVKVEA
ncbi:hypothetical protein [Pajaroellobacter abortibovis]|nr:hypothetical protein [Pajaroellobacter abortibovis]